MRIYGGLVEAYCEIERDLLEVGEWISGTTVQDKNIKDDPEFDFMELRPYIYQLTRWEDRTRYEELLGLNVDWIEDEFFERVHWNHKNPGSAWSLREEVWIEFIQSNGRFAYTYNERFRLGEQLSRVIHQLGVNPHTRQAVVTVFNPILDMEKLGGFQRVPCSLSYQFLIRNGRLELIYSMRSCDFFTHFPYDQLLAIELLRYVGMVIDRPCNRFTHVIGSLHGFRKDFPKEVF